MTSKNEIKKLFTSKNIKIEILTKELIEQLLSKKSIIGQGATSIAYKVSNCYTHKGFLCLKVLINGVFRTNDANQNQNHNVTIWNEEEEGLAEESNDENSVQINLDLIQQLFMEYEILNNLNHPNIIKVYGFYNGDETNDPAILLEYCRFNLEQVVKELDDIYLVGIIYEICSAMQYVHAKKIIHRDLKMKNILINMKKHVKICDFGISKVMDLTTQTSMTHGIGTIPFMAPELFKIDAIYNEKVDVFAFGVVMFYILSKGQSPSYVVPGNYEQLTFPSTINELSRSIIKKCLSSSADERPSFYQLLQEIKCNNFLLIDGINDQIPNLKDHLGIL